MSIEAHKQGLEAELKRQLEPTVNGIKNTDFYYKTLEYAEKMKLKKDRIDNTGKEGFNEYGLPLHACNGYIQNAHYWAWIGEKNRLNPLNWMAPKRIEINAE